MTPEDIGSAVCSFYSEHISVILTCFVDIDLMKMLGVFAWLHFFSNDLVTSQMSV